MHTNLIKPKERLIFKKNRIIHKKTLLTQKVYSMDAIEKILILTTDLGPIVDDVVLTLFFKDQVVLILPSEHPSYETMYDALSQSLTLRYDEVIKAMSCTERAEFIIWDPSSNEKC